LPYSKPSSDIARQKYEFFRLRSDSELTKIKKEEKDAGFESKMDFTIHTDYKIGHELLPHESGI